MICSECGSQHQADWACHECARRSLMRRFPVPEPSVLITQLYVGLAKYVLKMNDQAAVRFLDEWQNGRKKTDSLQRAPAHGLASRLRIEGAMQFVLNERTAEARRQAVVF